MIRVMYAATLLAALPGWLAPDVPSRPREYEVDTERSRLWVVTHRSGVLSFLGHEHAIVPAAWSAQLCLEEPASAGAAGAIVIVTSSLVIDSEAARSQAGLGKGPGAQDVGEIQRKLLDSEHLDANRFPEIRLDLLGVQPAAEGSVRARVRLTLRGVDRSYELPVGLELASDGTLQLTGMLRVRQRDFGIEPESRAGVVRVSDGVDLHFVLLAAPTTRSCVLAPAPG